MQMRCEIRSREQAGTPVAESDNQELDQIINPCIQLRNKVEFLNRSHLAVEELEEIERHGVVAVVDGADDGLDGPLDVVYAGVVQPSSTSCTPWPAPVWATSCSGKQHPLSLLFVATRPPDEREMHDRDAHALPCGMTVVFLL